MADNDAIQVDWTGESMLGDSVAAEISWAGLQMSPGDVEEIVLGVDSGRAIPALTREVP